MTTTPDDPDRLLRRTDAQAAGVTDRHLMSRVRSGELIRLRPGVYAAGVERTPESMHRLEILATEHHLLTVSHRSAAVLHGLRMLKPDLSRIDVSSGSRSGGRIHPTRHIHSGLLDADDVVIVDGVAVTSLERTAADVACMADFDRALVVLDSALRAGADRDAIGEILARRRRQGVSTARIALSMADRNSESVGESWSRAQMITARLPLPRLQDARVIRGRRVIPDFDWDRQLVGEFDGHIKYGRLLRPGQTVVDVVADEKAREDLLRWDGSMVLRWVWSDLERRRVVGIVAPWLHRLGLM
ncbi:type IV toxin-antitoxin system AbiEi family antitoxin domain-containing protein [Williamsia phyllosphaerae]|uniref:AbiEi antitoxin N-terminal domain-containing protein n=1 Tax=Williamsia phyllosphaerae TaxID=885042 RepID=A0ABQ1V362_9NOCA|nr:type IV toxin-antitoxin system AbiEi family antitoxin domain-containing protein [Williamsia phyllosphaerae]GGF34355.1 hypothetical protein GCM10007298_32690 [Williamsia phyllosphaerae]